MGSRGRRASHCDSYCCCQRSKRWLPAAELCILRQPSRSCVPSTPLTLFPSLFSYSPAREQHALLSKQWRIIKIRPQTICKRGGSSCETMATATAGTASNSTSFAPSFSRSPQNKWPTLESPAGRGRGHEQRLPRHMLINIFMFAEVLGVPAPRTSSRWA